MQRPLNVHDKVSAPSPHGYDELFEPELDKKYMCPVCLAALRSPVQTKCGHRFCAACVKRLCGTLRYFKCPVDNSWFDTIRDVFADTAMHREVLSLTVKCTNVDIGCTWIGELRDLQKHVGRCPEGMVDCTNSCGTSCKRATLDKHLQACPKRLEACSHCALDITFSDMTKHQVLTCAKFPVTCSVCGEPSILRDDIPRHMDLDNGDCPLVVAKCAFEHVGCYHQDKRMNMSNHYLTAINHHMTLMCIKIAQQDELLSKQQQQLANMADTCQQQRQRILEQQDKSQKTPTLRQSSSKDT